MFALALLTIASLNADTAFNEGRKLYDDLEYEQAVFRFQEVALRADVVGADRATALVWLGLSYAGVGDEDAARRAFVDGARADATLVLPVEVSPRLAELFDDAKRAAAATAIAPPTQPTTIVVPSDAPPPDDSTSILAGVGTVTGVLLVGTGVGLAVLCAVNYDNASDRTATQVAAKAALDEANLELVGAALLIPVGAAMAGVAGFLFFGLPAADQR